MRCSHGQKINGLYSNFNVNTDNCLAVRCVFLVKISGDTLTSPLDMLVWFKPEMASCESDPKETRNKEEKTDNSEVKLPDLPQEIIVEIVARLPVKSLLRFRCVCKLWRILISSPNFVKKHLHLSNIDENHSHHRSIITIIDPDFSVRFCLLNSLYNYNYSELEFPLKDPKRRSDRIVGSCNGLLCIQIEGPQIVLWNPSTRQIKILPGLGIIDQFPGCSVLYGFGYDKSIDDYKVAVLYSFTYGLRLPPSKTYVRVFTLRTNSWREIGEFPYPCDSYPSSPSIFVSGSLNWEVTHGYGGDSIIVSFDLATETYSELPQPDISFKCLRRMGVLGGRLCISCSYPQVLADVWVMKEYGVRESWTKLFTIPFPVGTSYYKYMHCPKLFCFANNGELLLQYSWDSQLLLYNPEDNTFSSTHGFPTRLAMDSYVESLVSPTADDQVESLVSPTADNQVGKTSMKEHLKVSILRFVEFFFCCSMTD